MTTEAKVPTTPLDDGETVIESFRPDRAAYIRVHAWLAALAMGGGMAVLWLIGDPFVWTGAIGGLAAILVRGVYLASDDLGIRWDLTDRRLLGPGPRQVPLNRIDKVRDMAGAVQVVTIDGEKHLIRYLPDPGAAVRRIDAARR